MREQKRAGYVYTLHFDRAIAHTRHYTGCTTEVQARLASHAQGRGARLMQVLKERGIGWRLGGLSHCTLTDMRRLERMLKRQHDASRYCQLCHGADPARRLAEARPIDLDVIPFATDSESLASYGVKAWSPVVRLARPQDPAWVIEQVGRLAELDRHVLGFIPTGGWGGLPWAAAHNRLVVALLPRRRAVLGYVCFTTGRDTTKVQQCCTADAHRGSGVGRKMVDYLGRLYPDKPVTCWVRDDLPANEFWRAIGFDPVAEKRHKTSGSRLVQYEREPDALRKPSKPSIHTRGKR